MIQHFCQWILNLLNTNGRWRYVSSDLCWKFWFIIRLHSWHYNILIGKLSWFQKRKRWKKENRDSTQRKIYNLSGLARRYNCRCPRSTLPLLYESRWSAIRRSHIILPLLFGRVFPSYTKRTECISREDRNERLFTPISTWNCQKLSQSNKLKC